MCRHYEFYYCIINAQKGLPYKRGMCRREVPPQTGGDLLCESAAKSPKNRTEANIISLRLLVSPLLCIG